MYSFTYVHHLRLNHPCCVELKKQIYIFHILDTWRLQECSSNEKRVLPRRYLFFRKWWLWEGSCDKKRVLLRRYLFFSKFVACCTVSLCSSFTIVNHVVWNWIYKYMYKTMMATVLIEVIHYLDSSMVPQWVRDERRGLQSCCFKNTEWDFGNGFLKKFIIWNLYYFCFSPSRNPWILLLAKKFVEKLSMNASMMFSRGL